MPPPTCTDCTSAADTNNLFLKLASWGDIGGAKETDQVGRMRTTQPIIPTIVSCTASIQKTDNNSYSIPTFDSISSSNPMTITPNNSMPEPQPRSSVAQLAAWLADVQEKNRFGHFDNGKTTPQPNTTTTRRSKIQQQVIKFETLSLSSSSSDCSPPEASPPSKEKPIRAMSNVSSKAHLPVFRKFDKEHVEPTEDAALEQVRVVGLAKLLDPPQPHTQRDLSWDGSDDFSDPWPPTTPARDLDNSPTRNAFEAPIVAPPNLTRDTSNREQKERNSDDVCTGALSLMKCQSKQGKKDEILDESFPSSSSEFSHTDPVQSALPSTYFPPPSPLSLHSTMSTTNGTSTQRPVRSDSKGMASTLDDDGSILCDPPTIDRRFASMGDIFAEELENEKRQRAVTQHKGSDDNQYEYHSSSRYNRINGTSDASSRETKVPTSSVSSVIAQFGGAGTSQYTKKQSHPKKSLVQLRQEQLASIQAKSRVANRSTKAVWQKDPNSGSFKRQFVIVTDTNNSKPTTLQK